MGRRKHLAMGIEEFFALATLIIGKPDRSARDYASRARYLYDRAARAPALEDL